MKIALLMNHNSYPGREYLLSLKKANISVDVLLIGQYPIINKLEEDRCGGLWNPPPLDNILTDISHFHFDTLKSQRLINHLSQANYDIGIQGGTGIIKNSVISLFKIGILNFHPGDLPLYRGCSAPEWQLVEGRPIVCTCHLIDEGIDSGSILSKKVLSPILNSYFSFRSTIYPEIAKFIVEILLKYLKYPELIRSHFAKQDNSKAVYRKYIGDEMIQMIKNHFNKFSKSYEQL
ncbi:MAG: hypothetical protein HQK51_14930 [Oligoflexia bacterium]|nr:hypothetical protein [Oligoflexia bacterium]